MKHRLLAFTAILTLALSAGAQQPVNDAVLSNYLRKSYAAVSKDLVAAVAMMPEEDFGFRPAGVVKEVRTFGEIVAHIAVVNSWVCAMGDGKPNSTATPPVDKAGLVTLVNEINTRCTAYFATLTDAALTQTITTGSAPRQLQSTHGIVAMFAIAHSNEHYGNVVTYLRAHGLVPPAAAAQTAPVAPVIPPKP